MARYRVIVPTYQADKHLPTLLPALLEQSVKPRDVLVVDSSSRDGTVHQFKEFGAEVIVIPQAQFDHGGTRRLAAQHCADSEFIVMLTQDAIPVPGAFDRLLAAFDDPVVGAAYGRQRPRPQAAAIERHARLFNYPPASSTTRRFEDRERFGMKTVFCSNSFAAYRSSALREVGCFPEESFFGEDQIVAGRMLIAGWHLAYVSDAEAIHSHGYRIRDDFKRYFDIGVFHSRNRWLLDAFGTAEGEGMRFVLSELKYLIQHEPVAIPSALARTILKYAGYRIGMYERRMHPKMKALCSSAPLYWMK